MEKTNNTINTQNNANETIDTSNKTIKELTNEKITLHNQNLYLQTVLKGVAKHFLQEQVQDIIYKTHDQNICDFRDVVETHYSKLSDLWHTLNDDQKELLSDILHLIEVSTGMLLSEVYKAGIKACNTHGETLESLNYLEEVDVSKVFYDALPTNRY